ncbi:ImpA family metalloprotease [Piscinibacter sp.]|uniref:ImpA family metalloprotease n=1 Tax=Piscinibacter sp. TaxID=1903157 RepID=UPI0039E616AD
MLGLLTACGGGGGGNGSGSGTPDNGTGTTPAPAPAPTQPSPGPANGIDAALASGDPSALTDAQALMARALDHARTLAQQQAARIGALYAGVSSEYLPGASSQFIVPGNPESAQPLIVGDGGQRLAAISTAHGGRAAGYGENVLAQFRGNANLNHAPAFRRLLAWLASGHADSALPAPLNLSIVGLSAKDTLDGLAKAGVSAKDAACDALADSACAAGMALVIVGGDVAASDTLTARIRDLLQAGKPVLYVHDNGWGDSPSGRQVLAAMDLELGGYGGNFWDEDKVAAGRSSSANEKATAQFGAILPLLERLAGNTLRTNYDWSPCSDTDCDEVTAFDADVLAPAEDVRGQLDAFNSAGRNLFTTPNTTLLRLLSLWADTVRKQIAYPLDKAAKPADFQRAVIADAWVSYVRHAGGRQTDLGSYLGGKAATLPVSSADETVKVTLTGADGFTAIGRFAAPGQPLQVTLLDAGQASVALRINTQRSGSTKWGSSRDYTRPRYLASPAIRLAGNAPVPVVTPYGGLLQLQFSGATPGQVVTLRLRGAARQPFLDLTANGDRAAFVTALADTPFEWAEIKLAGLEAHTRVDMLREVINDTPYQGNVDRYLDEMVNLFFESDYDLAGFARGGRSLPDAVRSFCAARGWNCTDATLHRGPGTQHVNADVYAQCGIGCSGNPYDQTWGVTPRGWGESHELGHNLQLGELDVYGGRSGEVSNNLFPLHKKWRLFRELGVNEENARVSYRSAFDRIVAAKANATPVQAAYQALWADDRYAAQNGERLAFYMQWVHHWAERTGNVTQGWNIVTLLYLHARQLAAGAASGAEWDAKKAALGYGQYTSRPKTDGNDNLLLALSTITQRDQRATFDLWGVKYSAAASNQVDSYRYDAQPAFFYANTGTNDHGTVRKVDMTVAKPAWPF